MGAREKLNQAYASGSLMIAAVVGFLAQSWWAFVIAATILLLLNMSAGDIRPGKRR
jgi:hypothetical protein